MSKRFSCTAVIFTAMLLLGCSAVVTAQTDQDYRDAAHFAGTWLNPFSTPEQNRQAINRIRDRIGNLDNAEQNRVRAIERSSGSPEEKGRQIVQVLMDNSEIGQIVRDVQSLRQETEKMLESNNILLDPHLTDVKPVDDFTQLIGEDLDDLDKAKRVLQKELVILQKDIAFPTYEIDGKIMLVTAHIRRLAALAEELATHLHTTQKDYRGRMKTLIDLLNDKYQHLPKSERDRKVGNSKELRTSFQQLQKSQSTTRQALKEIMVRIRKLADVAKELRIARVDILIKKETAAAEEVTTVLYEDLNKMNIDGLLHEDFLESATSQTAAAESASDDDLSLTEIMRFINSTEE